MQLMYFATGEERRSCSSCACPGHLQHAADIGADQESVGIDGPHRRRYLAGGEPSGTVVHGAAPFRVTTSERRADRDRQARHLDRWIE